MARVKRAARAIGIGCGILITAFTVRVCFWNPNGAAELIDFQASPFQVQTGEPLYLLLGDRLYFRADGRLEPTGPLVWQGTLDGVWASPDSRYAIVLARDALYLVKSSGEVEQTLKPAGRLFSYNGLAPYWDAGSIQWTADSRFFLILRRSGNAVAPVDLYRYQLGSSSPIRLDELSQPRRQYLPSDGYLVSRSGQVVYYTLTDSSSDYGIYRLNVLTKETIAVRDVSSGAEVPAPHPADPADMFVNLPRSSLASRDDQGEGWSSLRSPDGKAVLVTLRFVEGDECWLGLYRDGQLTPILRSLKGDNVISGPFCGIHLSWSYFLPGSRYAFVNVDTAQHLGLLAIDIDTFQISPVPAGLEVFFTLNSDNTQGIELYYSHAFASESFDRALVRPLYEKMIQARR